MYISMRKKNQSHFTLDTMEKGEPSGHLPGDGPRLGMMSAQRSGLGLDPARVTRISSSWTQQVPEPQIAGGWQIILKKNFYNLLLLIYTQQSISATIKGRDKPGQPSLHYILIMKKDGEGMEVESMTQSLDWEWHQLDYA